MREPASPTRNSPSAKSAAKPRVTSRCRSDGSAKKIPKNCCNLSMRIYTLHLSQLRCGGCCCAVGLLEKVFPKQSKEAINEAALKRVEELEKARFELSRTM